MRVLHHAPRKLSAAIGFSVILGAAILAGPAKADPIVGVVGPRTLVGFDSATPDTFTTTLEVTGIGNDTIRGIDFRPATGQLYALGQSGGLYTVDTTSGAATAIGPGVPVPAGLFEAGFSFNPTVDAIRVTTANDVNRRVNATAGSTIIDGTLSYTAGDPNAGVNPTITAVAYTNQLPGTVTSTTLYAIDSATSSLVTINPANAGTISTIGALGIDLFGPTTGFGMAFDIDGSTGIAYASLLNAVGQLGPQGLFTIDLATGLASFLGDYGSNTVREITVGQLGPVAVPAPASLAILGTGLLGLFGLRRRRAA
ncbi:DUF4394 domain-containing protein [Roseomonas frigidaquae]|uniref:DUF4394 domain-containing protein n=1 Tax=Falsiroseomonas frigidaquae TaxID=487318 RepID=A0ABX1F179_9PROT|nr:DUF4394 domain-containing protein [Falsiroseomonas frigidaquae]NKE46066.1 DUF4394 domain-containing protein [Falsiroseomonas frigidaquae]